MIAEKRAGFCSLGDTRADNCPPNRLHKVPKNDTLRT